MKIEKSDIIIKTTKGQKIAYDRGAGIDLPRRLKTFLLLIDDKCSFDVYQESLKAYGDVEDLVVFLIDSGYVEIKGRQASKPKLQATSELASQSQPESADLQKIISDMQTNAKPSQTAQGETGASHVVSAIHFDDLLADIAEVAEARMGGDALELLMFLETIETYQGLVSALPHIKHMATKHTTGDMAFKQIEKVVAQKAA